uniref:Uncharacterized protein n=1 Tax=Physcomitrium patens TaxID=3218 RepID=A0A2K1ICU9_PHYPA|nr:hypothetical protein PHYPA_030578 [Physcomitrium patens]
MTCEYVAGREALLQGKKGEVKVYVADISSTFCMQFSTFLEALATRFMKVLRRLSTIMVFCQETVLKVMQQRQAIKDSSLRFSSQRHGLQTRSLLLQ